MVGATRSNRLNQFNPTNQINPIDLLYGTTRIAVTASMPSTVSLIT
jgi:hypothetical protein